MYRIISDENFYFLNAALSLTSFIMTIINIFTKEHILMFATLLFAVLCLLNIILLYFSKIPLRLMCKHCRFCRWGGEEFLLIMQCEHDAIEQADKAMYQSKNSGKNRVTVKTVN